MAGPTLPEQFKAAVFPAMDAPLEIIQVDFRQPGPGQLVLKVHACSLSNNDAIFASGLLEDAKWPRTPGAYVCGEVVAIAPAHGHSRTGSGEGKLGSLFGKLSLKFKHEEKEREVKVGDKVIAIVQHNRGGLAEYCTLTSDAFLCPILDKFDPLDQLVAATSGGRAVKAYRRFVDEDKKRTEQETEAARRRDEERGMKGEGVVVVYGAGGYARMCLTAITAFAPAKLSNQRVVLVTPSDRWPAKEYRIGEEDMLVVGRDDVREKLREMGGVKLVLAADQPHAGFTELLHSMRYQSEIVLLTLKGHEDLKLNTGELLAHSIAVSGGPHLLGTDMHRTLTFLAELDLRAHLKIHTSDFTREGVNDA
ncbi:hypothetical protein JCM8097_003938 [Rhodosporidiobolus ruineniae]